MVKLLGPCKDFFAPPLTSNHVYATAQFKYGTLHKHHQQATMQVVPVNSTGPSVTSVFPR